MSEPSREHLLAWLRLARIRDVGPVMGQKLVQAFGTPERVLQASPARLLQVNGVGPRISDNILAQAGADAAEAELDRCRDLGISLLAYDDPEYPELLKQLSDPPLMLYCRGKLDGNERARIAIVGCRSPDEYGRVMAKKIGAGLAAAGVTVVSGMALGIDSIAQEGALKAGGKSIAVLGSGVDQIYPRSNDKIYEACVEAGAVVSEFPLGTKPAPENFPRRNRIISGLSMAVVVIQAMSRRSGSLITVRFALEQGREVYAVPDRAGTRGGRVMNHLIKQGARLVEDAGDIIRDILPQIPELINEQERSEGDAPARPDLPQLESNEQKIYALIPVAAEGQVQVDGLVRQSAIEPADVSAILLRLELYGLIHRLAGNRYVRTEL